jgi:hypothetical protein
MEIDWSKLMFFKFPPWRENRKGAAPICCCEEKAGNRKRLATNWEEEEGRDRTERRPSFHSVCAMVSR